MDFLAARPLLVCTLLLGAVVGLALAAPATAQIIWRPPPGSNVYVPPSPVAETPPPAPEETRVASRRPSALPVHPEAIRALPLLTSPVSSDPLPSSTPPSASDEASTVPYDWAFKYAHSLFDSLFPSRKTAPADAKPPDSTLATRMP